MKIGIMGCGYVGQALASKWKQEGHYVSVTTRKPERVASLQAFANEIYLLNSQPLATFLSQQEALLISVAPDSSSDYATTYLQTARQVAEQVIKSPSLQQIFYTSSTSVYGDHQGEWVDEALPLVPTHEKTKILYEAEKILLNCPSNHLSVCILRLGEIYGPGREIEHRLRRMQHQSFAGKGDSYTNLIHLTDIIQALDFALRHCLHGIYNLCSDFHLPRRLFYDKVCQQEGLGPIRWDPSQDNFHVGNKRVSNQKIKQAGFTFTHSTYWPEPI